MKKSTSKLRLAAVIALPLAGLGAAALVTIVPESGQTAIIDPGCITPADPTTHTGTNLDAFAQVKSGVVFNPAGGGLLQVTKQAGQFKNVSFTIADPIEITCAADFDLDGWTDFVGATGNSNAGSNTSQIRFYKNNTSTTAMPSAWSNTTTDCTLASNQVFGVCIRQPKFDATKLSTGKHIEEGGAHVGGTIVCGDFNNDSRPDFLIMRCNGTTENCGGASSSGTIRADMFLHNGLDSSNKPTFKAKYSVFTSTQLGTTSSAIGNIRGPTVRASAVDLNADGWLDLVIGLGTDGTSSSKGRIIKAINNKAASPTFQTVFTLLNTNANGADKGFSALAVGKVTAGDNILDVLVGSEGTTGAWLYTDLLGGGAATVQTIATPYNGTTTTTNYGRLSMALVADFDKDGDLDGFAASNNSPSGAGGNAYVWSNNNSATPFTYASPNRAQQITAYSSTNQDYDGGFFLDYDHDPDSTTDIVVMDDDTGNYRIIANLVQALYAPCGSVTTGELDLGALETEEASVTEVCIQPTMNVPSGTSFKWEVSNDGANFVPAAAVAGSSPTKYCASFSNSIGKKVKWRAWLYSNATQSCSATAGTKSPTISAVQTSYTYVTAENHFHAGPVADQDLVYVGAMRQPGGAGELFVLDNETLDPSDARSWDGGKLLDLMNDSDRHIYISAQDGTVVPMTTSVAASTGTQGQVLRSALGTDDPTLAATVVGWMRSARFGLETYHRLGAIESSTVAVLSAPGRPAHFDKTGTSAAEKTKIDAFVAEHNDRKQLVFVGSRDGMLHAFYTNPDNVEDPLRGREMWAYVPYTVAPNLIANCINSGSDSPKTCKTTNKGDGISQYPDGSPTLADVLLADGEYHTILVMGEGNGGNGMFALDVTETVSETDGTVIGPKPLWHFTHTNMGRTYSKPAIARIKKDGAIKTLVIFASGQGTVAGLGDSVYALDASTGALVWELDLGTANAYISTDVAAYESSEAGTDKFGDGFIDRIAFADTMGRVYKVDPAAYDESGDIETIGTLDTSLPAGRRALFTTKTATDPFNNNAIVLGEERAIAGSIGVKADNSNEKRAVLFFGTGGTDDTPNSKQNAFFAVYSDTGEVKRLFKPAAGVKFYGGVTVLDQQLIFTSGKDLSGTGLCAPTAGAIQVLDVNTLAVQFELPTTSKLVAPMYAAGGQIYTVTLKGELVSSIPKPVEGGGSSGGSGGTSGGSGGTSGGGTGEANGNMQVTGWRQVD